MGPSAVKCLYVERKRNDRAMSRTTRDYAHVAADFGSERGGGARSAADADCVSVSESFVSRSREQYAANDVAVSESQTRPTLVDSLRESKTMTTLQRIGKLPVWGLAAQPVMAEARSPSSERLAQPPEPGPL